MGSSRLSRRRFVQLGAGAAAAYTAAPYIKSARSAGALTLGLWDHWVPGVNDVMKKVCTDWGAANNVEVTVDFITSIGNKLLLTGQAESRAGTGHDVFCVPLWFVSLFRDTLVPMDDVVEEIVSRHGPLIPYTENLARIEGTWKAVPAPTGSLSYGQVSRADLYLEHAGVDLKAMFPAGERDSSLTDSWDWEAFLAAAEKLHAAGKPFGAAIAPTPDASAWLCALFAAYGSVLVDGDGDITVDSDQTREVLEYLTRLTQFMPQGVYAWDDAGNNRWMISGEGASIFNPPSAWAVAKRDNPDVAQHFWHHDVPRGPAGRFRASTPFFWGAWDFSDNIGAAKDLFLHVSEPSVVTTMLEASQGFDLPLIEPYFHSNEIWGQASPPDGVLYNYPIRGDEVQTAAGIPAPPEIASQIATQGVLPNLVAQVTQGGDSFDDAIDWATNELEGLMRG
jgi:ABC-type glycerol-3-phosphate transport system substrate-binding protein